MRLLIYLLAITALLAAACSKSNSVDERQLYGTWIKGTQAGDTLWFMRKDGKNIMRSNQSFNASLPNYEEIEYRFKEGQLSRVLPIYVSSSGGIAFTWKQTGQQFEIPGYQLYRFMSSTATVFTFTKVS